MSLAVLRSRALSGIDAPAVSVEVHLANGLPSFTIVGLPDTEVKESKDPRYIVIRAAIGALQSWLRRRACHAPCLPSAFLRRPG